MTGLIALIRKAVTIRSQQIFYTTIDLEIVVL